MAQPIEPKWAEIEELARNGPETVKVQAALVLLYRPAPADDPARQNALAELARLRKAAKR